MGPLLTRMERRSCRLVVSQIRREPSEHPPTSMVPSKLRAREGMVMGEEEEEEEVAVEEVIG